MNSCLRSLEKGYKPNWHKVLEYLGLASLVLLPANKSQSEAAPRCASDIQGRCQLSDSVQGLVA